MSIQTQIAAFTDALLRGNTDAPHVLVGPCRWDIAPGSDVKTWYVLVGSADDDAEFHLDRLQVNRGEPKLAGQCRAALVAELRRRSPIVIHDFDCELEMLRYAAALWPSDAVRRLRDEVGRWYDQQ